MELLAPEVTSWSDGGGVVRAARRPLYGPDHVARWLLGVWRKPEMEGVLWSFEWINGEEGLLLRGADGVARGSVNLDIRDGVVCGLRAQLNPEKLAGLDRSEPFDPSAGATD